MQALDGLFSLIKAFIRRDFSGRSGYKNGMNKYTKKAPFNDWWYWSDTLVKRLRTVADIYRENDEKERGDEMAALARKLYTLFVGPAQKGQKAKDAEAKAAVAKEEEAAIEEAVHMWRDVLAFLPFVSQTMESYLSVTWPEIDPNPKKGDGEDKESDDGKTSGGTASSAGGAAPKPKKIDPRAVELFWGPKGRYDEGIRSGSPKNGGLPGILETMLKAEKTNSSRTPTEYKNEKDNTVHWRSDANKMKGPGGM